MKSRDSNLFLKDYIEIAWILSNLVLLSAAEIYLKLLNLSQPKKKLLLISGMIHETRIK